VTSPLPGRKLKAVNRQRTLKKAVGQALQIYQRRLQTVNEEMPTRYIWMISFGGSILLRACAQNIYRITNKSIAYKKKKDIE
jgi:hypothetical protein